MIEVVEARFESDYILKLKFNTGQEGLVDLSDQLWGPAFTALKDPNYFKRVAVSSTLGTITWPNGADFAPEFLLEHLSPL